MKYGTIWWVMLMLVSPFPLRTHLGSSIARIGGKIYLWILARGKTMQVTWTRTRRFPTKLSIPSARHMHDCCAAHISRKQQITLFLKGTIDYSVLIMSLNSECWNRGLQLWQPYSMILFLFVLVPQVSICFNTYCFKHICLVSANLAAPGDLICPISIHIWKISLCKVKVARKSYSGTVCTGISSLVNALGAFSFRLRPLLDLAPFFLFWIIAVASGLAAVVPFITIWLPD